MANKKIFMSVTASAVIASALVAADDAEAASYKVKSGDSLWKIAQQYDTSVGQLQSLNNLSGSIIFPNQVIETGSSSSSSSSNSGNSSSGGSDSSDSSSGQASTYTVKSGDTLSGIAARHNISVSDLMSWNDLNSSLIHPGDKFAVSKGGSNDSGSSSSNSGNSGSSSSGSGSNTGSSEVYTVQSGDTLSGIASQKGVSVSQVKNWNNLSSSLILIGQKLNIGSKASSGSGSSSDSGSGSGSSASTDVDYDVDELISTAKAQQGVRYQWGGNTPSGFDCSGFIYYSFNKAGKDINRLSSASYYNRAQYVNNPQVGDLVFFENTYAGANGISHMGIYLGGGDFIHAGSDGVQVSNVNSSYWQKYFEGYKRFY
ncbi:LysM peptidoglycan-binding domain-containing protein [Lentibacillus salicampi]|uniref:LysM peptidoglycan-binding domain-containing protein n=1 Tax=Lentibacillus salicampi TaxID=175306 RepID=A0A4Y9AB80_9BACI|nr:LysM peptidoglycan-binding domain-containing protein [Lentibacillus salicampi]TFJ93063.1 LysM peptidoglycan-binding domain-containing protein [Lentibacillus salicampi]